MRLARFIKFSGYHKFNDRWALLGTVGWENGSVFEDANISTERGSQKIPLNWDDTWKFAAGVQYKWSDRLSTGAQFVYADYGKAKIDNDLLKGDYKRNDIFFFAMNANWKF